MHTFAHEDTVISSQPRDAFSSVDGDPSDREPDARMLERCRALFRQWGERMNSFDLSRQIYG